MSVCIQYTRSSAGQAEGEIFGLDVAVNNFLSAYFRYGTQDKFICRPSDIQSFEHFKDLAKAEGVNEARCVGLDPRFPRENLGAISTLFRPDPLIADLLWRRLQLPSPGFATCGLVHTMSGERIARAVGELCLAPSTERDALICPSEAIRDVVRKLWDLHSEYYVHHFGGSYRCPVKTPVIPLGVNTQKFAALAAPEKRSSQRQALNAGDDEIIILFVGRLSFATKAHPYPLFAALQRAASLTKKKLRLVMFGYFKPKDMEQHFRNLAAEMQGAAKIEFVLNDDPRFKEGLWAGADIFISLSDNIQESFGLTPVEAMACGLPTIATDWNGYRGSIRDGLDGYFVKTGTPPESAGMAIAEAYYNMGNYGVSLAGSSQSTFIDIEGCAEAIKNLADDAEKRRIFSASGKKRAEENFDWKHIIKAYEDLWRDLSSKPAVSKPLVPVNWQAAHPSYPNPFKMFSSFPSFELASHDQISVVMEKRAIEKLITHEMNYFVPELLAPQKPLLELIEIIRKAGSPTVDAIRTAFPEAEQNRILRCVGWMLKHGICALARHE